MTSEDPRAAALREIAKKRIVYQLAGMDALTPRTVPYGAGELDVYLPPGAAAGERRAAVLFVFGFPQPHFAQGFRHMGMYVSWAQLLAALGLVALVYSYADPVVDVRRVLAYVREHAAELGVDAQRIGVWSASGNVPVAVSLLMDEPKDAFKCAVLCYGIMPFDGFAAQAAGAFGFAHPGEGKSVDDLPRELPLFVARAGQDQPPLNQALDGFVAAALARNLPLVLANHASGPHSFDLFDDRDASRAVVKQIVEFLKFHLRG